VRFLVAPERFGGDIAAELDVLLLATTCMSQVLSLPRGYESSAYGGARQTSIPVLE
jgi:hypothetical protein